MSTAFTRCKSATPDSLVRRGDSLCECYVHALRDSVSENTFNEMLARSGWPLRAGWSHTAYAACLTAEAKTDYAECLSRFQASGCEGSGGTVMDFSRREAIQLGYLPAAALVDGVLKADEPWQYWEMPFVHFGVRNKYEYDQTKKVEVTCTVRLPKGTDARASKVVTGDRGADFVFPSDFEASEFVPYRAGEYSWVCTSEDMVVGEGAFSLSEPHPQTKILTISRDSKRE